MKEEYTPKFLTQDKGKTNYGKLESLINYFKQRISKDKKYLNEQNNYFGTSFAFNWINKSYQEIKMHEGIFIAASAGLKQSRKIDVIAQNIANVNNTGYKKDRLVFQEFMPPFANNTGFNEGRNILLPPAKSNINVSYVGISDSYTDYSPGSFKQTNGTFDLGIDGPGFYSVSTEEGVHYTRNGNFRLNTQNQLVNQKGQPILNTDNDPIIIDAPGADISIDPEGSITAGTGRNNLAIGKIKLTDFKNPKTLEKIGDGLFKQTDPNAETKPIDTTTIRQGFLESSNVTIVEEMTDMLATLRLFETYQKLIQSIDSMDDQSVNDIGRIG